MLNQISGFGTAKKRGDVWSRRMVRQFFHEEPNPSGSGSAELRVEHGCWNRPNTNIRLVAWRSNP